jgi:retron-type reverse transcriptase
MLCCSTVTFQLNGKSHKWSSSLSLGSPHMPHPLTRLSVSYPLHPKSLRSSFSTGSFRWFEHGKLLPTHQFGFRPKHSTLEQTHRLIRGINNTIDNRQYCSAAFLDISQAFDTVWHKGLLYKIWSLPLNYFLILNSYLSNRHFIVKLDTELTDLTPVNAGVPQGSILGPLLCLLYTADLPTSPDSITATFANDTAVIPTDYDSATNSQKLQASLLEIQSWLNTWRMKANGTKLVHVTFTTRRETCHRSI